MIHSLASLATGSGVWAGTMAPPPVNTVQTLTPNDVPSIRWQHWDILALYSGRMW